MPHREEVIIGNRTDTGSRLQATYLPWQGMNFISFKKDEIEIIDLSTRSLFEERFAGLGAMIGPHFHHRNPSLIPKIQEEERFPHIVRLKAKGVSEPFSHGIGRYAPWKIKEISDKHCFAELKGSDEWNGVKLAILEGQDFVMQYHAEMTKEGLSIELSVVSEKDSVMGLHTYYALPKGKNKVYSYIQPKYSDKGELKQIPSSWNFKEDHLLTYEFKEEIDYGFYPFPNLMEGAIWLETSSYTVKISYETKNDENSWQLWHPMNVSFVCIEPLSAKNPRKPILSVNSIKIRISIL